MIKIAETKHKILELIKNRWSPRSFSNKELSSDQILSLFEAASWAASAFNEQPWMFIYATKKESVVYNKILSSLIVWNQNWAKKAPLLIVTTARLNFSHNDKENRTAFYDLGQAVSNLSLQAMSMDLYLHQMSGFDHELAEKELNIPKTHTAVSVIAVGNIGNANDLPEDLKKLETTKRERKTIESFAFNKVF